MFTTLISLAIFSVLAIRGVSAEFTVNTPTITECAPVHVSWSGQASGPVNVIVVPSEDPCEKVLLDLGDHSNGALTFPASFTAGTNVMISLEDSAGNEAWSGSVLVGKGDSTSCLSASSASASASASASTVLSSSASDVSHTTLVVPAASKTGLASPSTDEGTATAIGAVNNGLNPTGLSSGAPAIHKLSGSAVALAALAAVLATTF